MRTNIKWVASHLCRVRDDADAHLVIGDVNAVDDLLDKRNDHVVIQGTGGQVKDEYQVHLHAACWREHNQYPLIYLQEGLKELDTGMIIHYWPAPQPSS